MDEDRRELANRLFAAATGVLEDAAEVAVRGQSAALDSDELAGIGRDLKARTLEVAALAEAAVIAATRMHGGVFGLDDDPGDQPPSAGDRERSSN